MTNRGRDLTDERLVTVATAPNEIVADLWRGLLADAGIRAMIKPIGIGSAYFSTFVNEHEVLVLESDADLARSILSSEGDGDEET